MTTTMSDEAFLDRVEAAGGDRICLHCRLSIFLQEYCAAEGIPPRDFVPALAQVAGEILQGEGDRKSLPARFKAAVDFMAERCNIIVTSPAVPRAARELN